MAVVVHTCNAYTWEAEALNPPWAAKQNPVLRKSGIYRVCQLGRVMGLSTWCILPWGLFSVL